VFKFGFGDYQGHTLTMIAWHGVLHETQTGHIAPGFGGFEVVGDEEVEDAADDEERDR
jgi:hypothetical protein